MRIEINGRLQEVPDGSNIAQLLEHLTLEPRRVAVELNKRLVPRGMFGSTSLAGDDQVEIVTLVGGG
jgi:thiamine biosynthesis protein ThiS